MLPVLGTLSCCRGSFWLRAYRATAAWSMTPRCGSTLDHSMERRKALQCAFFASAMSSLYLTSNAGQQEQGSKAYCYLPCVVKHACRAHQVPGVDTPKGRLPAVCSLIRGVDVSTP